MIEIRNGCAAVAFNEEAQTVTWEHKDAKSAGIITTYFTAPMNVIPKIGDYINENTFVYVARTEYKIVPNTNPQFPEDEEFRFRR